MEQKIFEEQSKHQEQIKTAGKVALKQMTSRCYLCFHKEVKISYKDSIRLKRYITDWGKILPRVKTRVCAFHQRQLAHEIKKARTMALLPSGAKKLP